MSRLVHAPLLFALIATSFAAAADRPNFILCMADDQGWGDVGYNGHPAIKTPVFDDMAARGLRLDRFYAAAPVCSPTRGSVLTGRHPNRFGCFSWGRTIRPQEVTVAEVLQQAGYATGHFGKWHLGSMRAGAPTSPGENGFDEWISSPNFYENSPLFSKNGKVIETDGESSVVTVDAALPFIREATRRKQPFLAVIWFGNPHSPHEPTPELRALYPDQPPKIQNYLGEITGIDRAMGLLRDEMKKLGIAENTLLWYTSDNGAQGPGSTGGLSGKKGSLWEGGIRVPCLLEWPARIKSPARSSVAAGTVDIYPTLLELAGAQAEAQPPLDGVSLVALIDGEMQKREKPLGFWVYPAGGRPMRSRQMLQAQAKAQAGNPQEDDPADEAAVTQKYSAEKLPGHAAWIDNDYKLHRIGNKSGNAKYSLYNLADDPAEKTDLAADQPDRAATMKKELDTWQKSVIQSLNGEDYR